MCGCWRKRYCNLFKVTHWALSSGQCDYNLIMDWTLFCMSFKMGMFLLHCPVCDCYSVVSVTNVASWVCVPVGGSIITTTSGHRSSLLWSPVANKMMCVCVVKVNLFVVVCVYNTIIQQVTVPFLLLFCTFKAFEEIRIRNGFRMLFCLKQNQSNFLFF